MDDSKINELINVEKFTAGFGHVGAWTKNALILNLISLPPVENVEMFFDTNDTHEFKVHVVLLVSPESLATMNLPDRFQNISKLLLKGLKSLPFGDKLKKVIELSPHSDLPIFKGNREDLKAIANGIVSDMLTDYKITIEIKTESKDD